MSCLAFEIENPIPMLFKLIELVFRFIFCVFRYEITDMRRETHIPSGSGMTGSRQDEEEQARENIGQFARGQSSTRASGGISISFMKRSYETL